MNERHSESQLTSSSAAVRDEGTLELPRAFTHDLKVASTFIIVSVEVQIRVPVDTGCIWDKANKEGDRK